MDKDTVIEVVDHHFGFENFTCSLLILDDELTKRLGSEFSGVAKHLQATLLWGNLIKANRITERLNIGIGIHMSTTDM